MRRLPDLATLRAAWWTDRALRHVSSDLARARLEDLTVAAPPVLPPQALRGVRFVLRRRTSTCLERALVLQAWHTAQGRRRAVLIGVTGGGAFSAHAWLEGDSAGADEPFTELVRLAAP